MTVSEAFQHQPQPRDEIAAAAESLSVRDFNLWCAMNSKPFRLASYVWPDGRLEWCVEIHPGKAEGTIAYGTAQTEENQAVVAAFAFLAGIEWAEAAARLSTGAALEEGEDGEDEPAADSGAASVAAAPGGASAQVNGTAAEYAAVSGGTVTGWTAPHGTPDPAAVSAATGPAAEKQQASFDLPGTTLLAAPAAREAEGEDESSLARNAKMLETVLRNFGIRGEIMEVRPGPVVTLYELEPAPGTKSSRVINTADDIARSMSAVSVRIALIPGRSVIGIELPNPQRETVFLHEMLTSEAYRDESVRLPLVLGKDIGGTPVVVDLAKMPHLLIAGTTGSGKSVGINGMILSLLYRLSPDQCRFIMVDPKMLELSVYDGIPHLLTPVVTDPKKAVVALKWAVREMESRYHAMSKLGVRNIEGYNQRVREIEERGETIVRQVQVGFDKTTGKPVFEDQVLNLKVLPYIVVIVDEMADLMLVAGKEIEAAIQRLAQMARAAGIHLIMATQRPSVDVITGTIKANFPTRISFQVTSKIDSRTILGEGGAEQLLGRGDMLYMAGGGRLTRVHGPFVADREVESVVNFLKAQGQPDYLHAITEDDDDDAGAAPAGGGGGAGGIDDDGEVGEGYVPGADDLYDRAVAIVTAERKCTVSFIQRHLQIGYNRAARMVEQMEQDGIVSGANHVGKREVLVSRGGRIGG
jgi:S-DNA-T family DNA segregation ATPase FtsK/SpoIIIE